MVKLDSQTASAADIFMEEQMRSIFQWEKSSGLEHSCYACNTKSNSPKALQTCYGIHSIPCSRYHQTMHAIGTSHNCDACIKADSLHDCRHRKIAELLAEHRSLCEAEPTQTNKKKKNNQPPLVPTTPTPLREQNINAANANLNNAYYANINRRHPRDLDPLDIENINLHTNTDEYDEADIDTSTISSTPTTTTTLTSSSPNSTTTTAATSSSSSSSHKPTKAEIRASKRASKQAKSEQKSLKNQFKHPVSVRAADVAHVSFVLHGDVGCDRTGNPAYPISFPSTSGFDLDADVDTDADALGGSEQPFDATRAGGAGGRAMLTPSRHPLATDTAIEDVLQRNIGYVTHIKEHKAYLLRSVAGKNRSERAKRVKRDKARSGGFNGTLKGVKPGVDGGGGGMAVFVDCDVDGDAGDGGEEEMARFVDAVLVRLGVDVGLVGGGGGGGGGSSNALITTPNGKHGLSSPSSSSSSSYGSVSGGSGSGSASTNQARNALLAQLRVAIGDDIKKHENEQRMTFIRAGGFWRYVGKGVFERMMQVGERIDWRTGVIIKDGAGVKREGEGASEGRKEGDGDGDEDEGYEAAV